MALKFSTGLRDMINGLKATIGGAIVGVGIDFVDGAGSDDTITDSGNGFITAGFAPGDILFIQGSTSNDPSSGALITAVAAGTLTFATGTLIATEVGLAGTIIGYSRGGSLKDIFKDGILEVFTGSQPASPDDAITGTKLIRITVGSAAWVAGAFDNGLEFEDDPLDGELEKNAEVWSGVGLAAGIASFFRFVGNPADGGGVDTTLPRIDGSVGISGADINMPNTAVTIGAAYTIDTFKLTLPEYYGA